MFHEYPKALYLRGWADLDAKVVVSDAAEEADARAQGYRMLSDPDEPAALAVVLPREDASVQDSASVAAPRRGRPPKARDE
jgi:hypothetical protein